MYPLIDKCLIWELEKSARVNRNSRFGTYEVFSPRAGGRYRIDWDQLADSIRELDNRQKSRLTSWVINMRQQGVDCPEITQEVIELIKRARPTPVLLRVDRILKHLSEQTTALGRAVRFGEEPSELYALGEATDVQELIFLLDFAKRSEWLTGPIGWPPALTVTIQGHNRVEGMNSRPDSSQAFVAMWFDNTTTDAYEMGIKPAISEAGFRPVRIDEKLDADKLDDEILAEIRRSAFIVADFTQGHSGARGGVYFEAGFATGLAIPVIYTCREDSIDDVHFDTRQHAHILWRDPEKFKHELRNRICARFGRGPIENVH